MKKNWFKLVGVAALVAVIGLGLAGCPTDDPVGTPGGGDPELTGTIHISTTSGGSAATTANTGATLYAVYSVSESVSYQWKNGGSNVASGGISSICTPTEAGSYTVTVSKTGAAVTVSVPATPGISWTVVPAGTRTGQSGFIGNQDFNDVVYGGGKFVATGQDGIRYSPDGATWTAPMATPLPTAAPQDRRNSSRWVLRAR